MVDAWYINKHELMLAVMRIRSHVADTKRRQEEEALNFRRRAGNAARRAFQEIYHV